MGPSDLEELEALLVTAGAVISMREVHEGLISSQFIAMRHDVDDNKGSLDTAVKMAQWERDRDFCSTYFLLHTADYWDSPEFDSAVRAILSCGHEIGIHTNALTVALTRGSDPAETLRDALDRLRSFDEIIGVAPHGDPLCHVLHYVNDEMFEECARPEMGRPDREIYGTWSLKLSPLPLAHYGLEYETYRLPRGRYLSDSGGMWSEPLESIAQGSGQLHILQHPDWWAEAFKEA